MRDKKTYAIIGAAMEVHKEMGSGFLETVYHEALEREFTYQEIPHKSQPPDLSSIRDLFIIFNLKKICVNLRNLRTSI